jgi:hypothetical protein
MERETPLVRLSPMFSKRVCVLDGWAKQFTMIVALLRESTGTP